MRNTKRKKKNKKSSLSPSFLAVTLLVSATLAVAFVFVACGDKDDTSGDSSEVMNQSGIEESVEQSTAGSSEIDASNKSETEESSSLASDTESNDKSEDTSKDTSNDVSEEASEESSEAVSEEVGGGEKYSYIAWFKSENGKRYDAYGEKNPDFTLEQVVTYVNIGLDNPYYTNTYPASKEDGNFILVNKYSYVDKSFEPDNLVELDSSCKVSGKSVKLVKEAADAFKELSAEAKALEYDIIGMSGYRSYSYQENLYNRYLQKDTQENVDTYSARPGYSEHHTGLALDVQTHTTDFDEFGQTYEYEWLLDNAHHYGFVIHYTYENQWITGYMPEEWHLRYLGVEAATYIYENNLSVDEYLVMFGAEPPKELPKG